MANGNAGINPGGGAGGGGGGMYAGDVVLDSITVWNRLEPQPRANMQPKDDAVWRALAARIRDPLWLLTRQWQLGEFFGADSGSPAYGQLSLRVSPFESYQLGKDPKAPRVPWPASAPLEALVDREPWTPDLASRAELGQYFESLLAEAGVGHLAPAVRDAYPFPPPDEKNACECRDQASARFIRVMGGRVVDGVALFEDVLQANGCPPSLGAQATQGAFLGALSEFVTWVKSTYGDFGTADAPAWRSDRLEYCATIRARGPGDTTAALSVNPTRTGQFDWTAFDLLKEQEPSKPAPAPVTWNFFPNFVRFRGMPNHRFWDFESGTTDFGAVEPELRDLAKLVVMDFMLVHGNDWFVTPIVQPYGSISWLDYMLIHDVFGEVILIERADAEWIPPELRWSMYSTSSVEHKGQPAPFVVLPPTASGLSQSGPDLEAVRFVRDDIAQMAWAIERTVENGLGEPWNAGDRIVSGQMKEQQKKEQEEALVKKDDKPKKLVEAAPGLRYRLQTQVPENWIPLLPVQMNHDGKVMFQRAAMQKDGEAVKPAGRIVGAPPVPYYIEDEEVPRAGLDVYRAVRRTRWTDGSTHLWVSRRRGPAAGEASSGLRFDFAETTENAGVKLPK